MRPSRRYTKSHTEGVGRRRYSVVPADRSGHVIPCSWCQPSNRRGSNTRRRVRHSGRGRARCANAMGVLAAEVHQMGDTVLPSRQSPFQCRVSPTAGCTGRLAASGRLRAGPMHGTGNSRADHSYHSHNKSRHRVKNRWRFGLALLLLLGIGVTTRPCSSEVALVIATT